MYRMTIISLVALSVFCVGSALPAATILLDLGPNDQQTLLPSWNNYGAAAGATTLPAGPFSLNYTTGTDSGIDFSIAQTSVSGISGAGGNYTGPYPAAVAGYPGNALLDSVYVNAGGTITATLSNLNPEGTYTFLIYGADGNTGSSPGVATTWNITGLNSGMGTISAANFNSTEVVLVEDIIPDGSNEISILMTSPGIGRWSTLEITEVLPPVPEPSSCLLLSLGLLGLSRYTRRRRQMAEEHALATT